MKTKCTFQTFWLLTFTLRHLLKQARVVYILYWLLKITSVCFTVIIQSSQGPSRTILILMLLWLNSIVRLQLWRMRHNRQLCHRESHHCQTWKLQSHRSEVHRRNGDLTLLDGLLRDHTASQSVAFFPLIVPIIVVVVIIINNNHFSFVTHAVSCKFSQVGCLLLVFDFFTMETLCWPARAARKKCINLFIYG